MGVSKNIKLNNFIESQIKQYLFEDDAENTLGDMLKYIQDEEKRTKIEINNDNRIKGAQINPDERKIKETSIKRNKERLEKMKKIEDGLKQQQALKTQQDQTNLAQTTTNNTMDITGGVIGVIGGVGVTENEVNNSGLPMLKRSFSEQAPAPSTVPRKPQVPSTVPSTVSSSSVAPVKKKTVRVMFDKSSGNPFYVDFSERGFSINGTRLSFELIESALSKEFNIVLEHGNGQMLDQVKMQKILKYKDRF